MVLPKKIFYFYFLKYFNYSILFLKFLCSFEKTLFLTSFVLYVRTCSRTVGTTDSPELITAAMEGGVPHPPGYPLLMILLRTTFYFTRTIYGEQVNHAYSAAILNCFFAALRSDNNYNNQNKYNINNYNNKLDP